MWDGLVAIYEEVRLERGVHMYVGAGRCKMVDVLGAGCRD